jgi:hypothetical protein
MKTCITLFSMTLLFHFAYSQSGPGGIGDVSGNSILQLWLRADTGIVVNANRPDHVAQWLDLSGAGNDVSAPVKKSPFYNAPPDLPCVRFNGKQYLQAPASASFFNPTATVFIVKKKAFTGAAISLSPGGFSQEMLILNKEVYHHHSSGNFAVQGSSCLNSIPNSEICIVEAEWGPGITEINAISNGIVSTDPIVQQGVQLPLSPINRKITIGQRDALTSSEYLVGNIMEVIGYNVKLTDVQRKAVEDYLACKYGITNPTCGNLTDCGGKNANSSASIDQKIKIYPNPASDLLHIDFGSTFSDNTVHIRVLNVMGQSRISTYTDLGESNGSFELKIDQLNPGNYLLIVEQGDKRATEKFLVN